MNTIGHNSIVVGVDGSPAGTAALGWAAEEAARRHLPLHLIRAREPELPVDVGFRDAALTAAAIAREADDLSMTLLTQGAARARAASPSLKVTVESSPAFAAAVLVEQSARADTIVLGSRGHGSVLGALLGSVSTQVSLHAECPVVILRERLPRDEPPRGIVVGVDGSAVSSQALGYAFGQASSRGTHLDVVHAWWTRLVGGVADELLEDQMTQHRLAVSESVVGWSEKFPDVAVNQHLPVGPAVGALVEQSGNAELLVVGSRGQGGFRRLLLGSVSHGVLQHAHCPVAVVRSPTDQPSMR